MIYILPSSIREPKRGFKDLCFISVAENKGCQNTDVPAVSKRTRLKKPLKISCHECHLRIKQFSCRLYLFITIFKEFKFVT